MLFISSDILQASIVGQFQALDRPKKLQSAFTVGIKPHLCSFTGSFIRPELFIPEQRYRI